MNEWIPTNEPPEPGRYAVSNTQVVKDGFVNLRALSAIYHASYDGNEWRNELGRVVQPRFWVKES